MKRKKAFISGISGQDGAYLAKYLLEKNYEVVGGDKIIQKKRLWRLKELNILNEVKIVKFNLLHIQNINRVIRNGKFDEFYNFAAQSLVNKSFNSPIYTSDVNSLGVTRILEAIKNFSKKTKFYQASSSEMFGNIKSKKRNEKTNFRPVSPYAISKLHAHWMIDVYRSVHNIYCCSGILFNHDSPLRDNEFVTKKIVRDLVKFKKNRSTCLRLGNIHVRRDWGYSKDYVEAIWKMLQQKKSNNYVISSGVTHKVKTFVDKTAKYLNIDLIWSGKGLNEIAVDRMSKKTVVKIDKRFFRPNEVNQSFGDSSKAKRILKWKAKINLDKLVKIMCEAEINK